MFSSVKHLHKLPSSSGFISLSLLLRFSSHIFLIIFAYDHQSSAIFITFLFLSCHLSVRLLLFILLVWPLLIIINVLNRFPHILIWLNQYGRSFAMASAFNRPINCPTIPPVECHQFDCVEDQLCAYMCIMID